MAAEGVAWAPRALVKEGLYLGQWDPMLPASLGGWRRASWADEITCRILTLLDFPRPLASRVAGEVRRHPAWPAVSFIEGFDEERALQRIAEIEDPCWHVDTKQPSSDELLSYVFGNWASGGQQVAAFDPPANGRFGSFVFATLY